MDSMDECQKMEQKCNTQHDLEKATSLIENKIENIANSLVVLKQELGNIEDKTNKIVEILAQNKLILHALQQLTESYAELQRVNKEDHSQMHAKMQGLNEKTREQLEQKIVNHKLEEATRIQNLELKYDQRLSDFVTHKSITLIIAICGILFAIISFGINYIDGILK